jgi:hypothetical protein
VNTESNQGHLARLDSAIYSDGVNIIRGGQYLGGKVSAGSGCWLCLASLEAFWGSFLISVPPPQILHSLPLAGAALAALGWSMRFRDRIEAVVYRKWLKRAPAAIAILPIVQYFVDN